MNCLICGSGRIIERPTVLSGFLAERIGGGYDGDKLKHQSVNLCHYKECTFSFYDRRLTDEEASRLYDGYRGGEYQKIREKYDCWYTAKINDAMNNDKMALLEQKRVIDKVLRKNISQEIRVALDYGGNQGESFTELTGTQEKYVYDISGVKTIAGVKNIRDYE